MDILFATPVPPLATKPRPHHFIRGLAAHGHAVHLLMQMPGSATPEELTGRPGWSEVREACASITWTPLPTWGSIARCASSLVTPTPLRVAFCRSRAFTRQAERIARDRSCSVIHVDRERMAPLLAGLPLPKVLDATDSISLYLAQAKRHGPVAQRAVSAFELLKMPRFERRMAKGYAACLVTTEEDAAALRATGQRGTVEVVPNGMPAASPPPSSPREEETLVFVGTMSYPPNVDAAVWFVRSVLPLIRAVRPRARLVLVGRDPTPAVARLARIPGIEVTGWVDDVNAHLRTGSVFVAPIRIGGGYPNKVAEALAAGIPIVATPEARAGIAGLVPGRHLVEARGSTAIAAAVLELLERPELGTALAEAGRAFARSGAGWDASIDRLEAIYARSARTVTAGAMSTAGVGRRAAV